jgi:hypothetical protein
MQKQGITLSQRQLEAFVTPSLLAAGGSIDYVTFSSLARPRAPSGVATPQYIRTADFSSDGVRGPNTMHFQVWCIESRKCVAPTQELPPPHPRPSHTTNTTITTTTTATTTILTHPHTHMWVICWQGGKSLTAGHTRMFLIMLRIACMEL